jgi:hypothetical protein
MAKSLVHDLTTLDTHLIVKAAGRSGRFVFMTGSETQQQHRSKNE